MNEAQTLTIADFLLARIAEDEAAAQVAMPRLGVPPVEWEAVAGDPRRIARCAVDRRIVKRCAPYLDPFSSTADKACTAEHELAEDMLRDLASVHADHPDYRQEWRP